ncbi:MAG: hypothetical protein PHI86_04695 [Candidatus Omnitrophica bacterium]|nr:hypothetical protein [Candidatus Omnitrophota bacterium]HOX54830.1 hypothetical protein [Candidatus Omnitrophota bacterium]
MKRIALILLVVALISFVFLYIKGMPVKIVEKISGPHSNIIKKEYDRVFNQDDLVNLWKRHTDNIVAMPRVNFRSNMVVAVFGGQSFNCDGIDLVKVRETRQAIYLHTRAMIYQSGQPPEKAEPFGLFVIPRSNKKLILIGGFQELIGGPEIRTVYKEFDAIP